ncbi:BglG family transcription antiterminator [Virgibacillus dokdonensis]|uniref:Putative licABCH operon regulator n=1 Tax=Virgibacillus dokdonensis TaxID=302167 RepID=A0A2K9IV06_9BACI|nr:PRD domain-containing protein [Virgibacillus dokdonensis]AUJ23602.1 putative licABCH operon regulator [Virgibacillus dokdonensis]
MSDFIIRENSVRLLKIISKRDYISPLFLSESLEVSVRTIHNYMKQVNQDLKGIAKIENVKGKGYRLTISEKQEFERLLENVEQNKVPMDSSKRRIASIINLLINGEKDYTLDEMAFELNLGRTTLVTELKKASLSLATYNLKIVGKPNKGMQLHYQEMDLRFFIIENIFNGLYGSYPLDHDVVEKIVHVTNQYDLESNTKNKILAFVVVMLDRLSKNHPLRDIKKNYLKRIHQHDLSIAQEISSIIESSLPIKITKEEVFFISIPIAGRRTPTNDRTMTEMQITEEINSLLNKILEQIGFKQEVIKQNETFFIDLQYHLTFMLNRLMFGLRINNPMLKDVRDRFPVAFKMAKIAGQVITQEYSIAVSDEELAYLAFYFEVFISQNDFKEKRFKKAAVVCGTGRGTARIIKSQLEKVLHPDTQLDVLSEIGLTKEQLNSYDLIFTTVHLPMEVNKQIIEINEIFDAHHLKKKVEEIAYMQSFKLETTDEANSLLYHLITEDKFFVLDSSNSYEANLEYMVEELIKRRYLDKGFTKRLQARSAKGSMVFDQFIALPHTLNNDSGQLQIALGVFQKQVKADNKEVKLIFLLGLPNLETEIEDYEQQLVHVYDEIVRISNDRQLVEKLSQSTNYEQANLLLKHVSRFNV